MHRRRNPFKTRPPNEKLGGNILQTPDTNSVAESQKKKGKGKSSSPLRSDEWVDLFLFARQWKNLPVHLWTGQWARTRNMGSLAHIYISLGLDADCKLLIGGNMEEASLSAEQTQSQ